MADRTSEEKYRELVENANSIILRMDTEGRVTFFNEFAEKFFGFSEEELVGKSVVGTIVPETDTTGRDLAEMIRNIAIYPEQYANNENENIRRNGERVWISWTNKTIPDKDGHVTEILCVGNDHTSRKAAEEELARARDELSMLLDVAQAASGSLDQNEVLRLTVKSLISAVGVPNVGIYLMDEDKALLFPLDVRVDPQSALTARRRAFLSQPLNPARDTFTREVLERKEPMTSYNVIDDPRTDKMIANLLGIKSLLSVPFVVKDRVVAIAMICTFDDYYAFSQDQIDIARGIANAAAVSIDNSKLYAEARRRADESETLFTIQQAITRRLDPEAVLQLIADEARRLTVADGTLVFLFKEGNLVVSVFSGELVPGVLGYSIPTDHSAAGFALHAGKPVRVNDARNDPRPDAELIQRTGFRSLICVPLISDSQPMGVIAVAAREPGVFGPGDERVLMMLASGAIVGLENARLHKEEQERRREAEQRRDVAESLRGILATLNSNRPLAETLDYIVAQASRLLGTDSGAIYRLERDSGMLVIQSSCGLAGNYIENTAVPADQGGVKEAVLQRKPLTVTNVAARLKEYYSQRSDPQIRNYLEILVNRYQAILAVPLVVKDELYGGLAVYYPAPKEFSTEDIDLAVSFGDQAALAIENARLRAQAEQVAVAAERSRLARELHDAVTQTLFSASLISEVLPRIWERDLEEGKLRLEELRQLTRGALAEMRTLLLELRPAALTEAALGDLLRQLAEAATGRARIPVSLEIEGQYPLLPDVQITLYRIAQEALNNISRHSGANRASIILSCRPGRVELAISDNGRGFDPGLVPPEHLGLGIMQERAEAIGALLSIESKAGRGTSIKIVWQDALRREST